MGFRRAAAILFLGTFAGQASFLVLSPILAEVAHEFDVSVASLGQLRLAAGLAGGTAALAAGGLARRLGLRDLLAVGLALIGTGAAASAAAPGLPVLVSGQLAIGAGFGIALSAATAAAAEWAQPETRSQLLSWTFIGQPAAWIVGMPIAGLVAEANWRLAWIAVPVTASVAALAATRARPADPAAGLPPRAGWREAWQAEGVRGWMLGELLAFGAWGGTLLFGGALLAESYGAPPSLIGLLLAAVAAAYLPGNRLASRWIESSARTLLVGLGLGASVGVAAFGLVRPSLGFSAAAFVALGFLAGARTLAGGAIALRVAAPERLAVAGMRAAATQFGYVLGAAAGGAALALGGYGALGATLGLLFAASTGPHLHHALGLWSLRRQRLGRPALDSA